MLKEHMKKKMCNWFVSAFGVSLCCISFSPQSGYSVMLFSILSVL